MKGKGATHRPVPANPRHIKDLKPDPENLREHNPRNIGVIVDTLQSVGAARSIVIDENDVILAGNGVIEAAGEAGITKVRVIEADGTEIIAVKRRGLTEDQKLELALADNRANELSTWKPDMIAALVAKGSTAPGKFWSAPELAKLLRHTVQDGHTDPEAVPDPRPTKIQRGDVYALGRHRLICGDSTLAEDVLRVMDGEEMHACITDPPYGIGLEYNTHDDTNAENEQLVIEVMKFAPSCRVWTPGKMNLARELIRHPQAKVISWYKKFSAAGNGMGGASTWEPILVLGAAGAHLNDDHIECFTDREPGLHALHPCPKPVALWVTLLEAFSGVGDRVYEPFCGSGTTLIAAEQTGRKVHAIEIDPQYTQVCIDRWEQFTHVEAVKVG